MSLELLNTFATCATFVVIAVTAVAAIIQLRHLRASNEIVAFNELHAAFESPHVAAAHKYVDTHLHKDLESPAFRYAIAHRSGRTEDDHVRVKHILNLGGLFENAGMLVRTGLVSRELVLASWSDVIVWVWKQYEPVTAIFRAKQDPLSFENFEYLAVLAQDWLQNHPGGSYPKNMRRLPLNYRWANEDREYEATR